jgi:hypothetical protein
MFMSSIFSGVSTPDYRDYSWIGANALPPRVSSINIHAAKYGDLVIRTYLLYGALIVAGFALAVFAAKAEWGHSSSAPQPESAKNWRTLSAISVISAFAVFAFFCLHTRSSE